MTWHWRSSCGCICRLGKWPCSFEYNRIRWKWVSFGLLYPELIFHLVHLSHFQFPTNHQLPALDILGWVGPFTALGCMVGGLLFKHATNRIDFSALLTDPVQPEDDGSVGRPFCLSVSHATCHATNKWMIYIPGYSATAPDERRVLKWSYFVQYSHTIGPSFRELSWVTLYSIYIQSRRLCPFIKTSSPVRLCVCLSIDLSVWWFELTLMITR